MSRPTRELTDVQHHVLQSAAAAYREYWPPGERFKLAARRAAQAQRTTHSGNAYKFAIEAAALLILEAEAINRQHIGTGLKPMAPAPGDEA